MTTHITNKERRAADIACLYFLTQDIRNCLFCCNYGDGDECGAGRLLYAGMNEWVHINCALWSAEVYEDDVGRLKNVYDAVKRGNKLVQCFKYFFCN